MHQTLIAIWSITARGAIERIPTECPTMPNGYSAVTTSAFRELICPTSDRDEMDSDKYDTEPSP